MPLDEAELTRTKDEIVQQMMAEFQTAISDVWLGVDGVLRMLLEVDAGQLESLWLANFILREDMFVMTASSQALEQLGDQFEVPRKGGTAATGEVTFRGAAGTYIPIDSEIAHNPGTGEENVLVFNTTADGTIPSPGNPTAPTTVAGTAGALTGTFEYAVAFLTLEGETTPGSVSTPLAVTSKRIELTAVALGGPGTTERKIYRRIVGGDFQLVATIANNVATTHSDNNAAPAGDPVEISTALAVTVAAAAEEVGVDFNVIPGTITQLDDVPNGVTSVTNEASFTGGTNEEDIEVYRTRLLNYIRSPATGSPTDLKGWAEEIEGVETATVFENDNLGTPTNGHVTVRISGPGGSIPSAGVQADVLAYLELKDIANIIIHVGTFTAISTNVTVDVTVHPDYTLGEVTPSVQLAVSDYINGLEVGATMMLSGIVDAVFGLAGITDVVVSSPGSNQTTAATSKRTAGTITVT